MNLTEIRAKIGTDLADPDKDILTPDMIDRAVDRAVSDLSRFFPREQIYDATLEYFNGDDLATNVWINKYCLKDSSNGGPINLTRISRS